VDVAELSYRISSTDVDRASRSLDKHSSSARKTETATDRMNKETEISSRRFREMGGYVRAASAALAAFGAARLVREVVRVEQSVQSMNRTFIAATGSIQAGAAEMEFARKESDRLGLNFEKTARSYAQLAAAARGSALEGRKTREVFTAVSEASAALGLSADQSEGALRALQQMMSKGTVQAEELRGQLGERIPGAFNLMAKGLGVTTAELNKMLEQGEVLAEKALPALAAELRKSFGSQAVEGSKQLTAQINRLDNAFFELAAEGSVDGVAEGISDLASALQDPATKQGLTSLINGMVQFAEWGIKAASGVTRLAKAIGENLAAAVGGISMDDTDRLIERQRELMGLIGIQLQAQAQGTPLSENKRLQALNAELDAVQNLIRLNQQLNSGSTDSSGSGGSGGSGGGSLSGNNNEEESNRKLAERLSLLREENSLIAAGHAAEEAKFIAAFNQSRGLEREVVLVQDANRRLIEQEREKQLAAEEAKAEVDDYLNADFTGAIEGFDGISRAIVGSVEALEGLAAESEAYYKARDAAGKDSVKLAEVESKHQRQQIGLYGDLLSHSKQYFKEGSSGYKTMEKAEKAFRAVEIALALENLAVKLGLMEAEKLAHIASEGLKQAASAVTAAISSMAGLPFPANLAALAATVVVLQKLGQSVFGGGGGGSTGAPSDPVQAIDTAGLYQTVGPIADISEQSEGIQNGLEMIASLSREQIPYLADMTRSLKNLEEATFRSAEAFVKGNFGSGTLSLSGNRVGEAIMGQLGGTFTGADTIALQQAVDYFRSQVAIGQDQRMSGLGSKAALVAGGDFMSNDTLQFNIESLNANLVALAEAQSRDSAQNAQNSTFARSIEQGIIDAAELMRESLGAIGIAAGDINSAILPDLSIDASEGNDAIRDKIAAFFDDVFNNMLNIGSPLIASLQQLGEGAIETVSRIVTQTEILRDFGRAFDYDLDAIGINSLIMASDLLAEKAGGVERFAANVEDIISLLTTDAEKIQRTEAAVSALFASFGSGVPETLDGLRNLVENLPDTTQEFGAEFFTAITENTDLLREYYALQTQSQEDLFSLNMRLLKAQGEETEILLRSRERELEKATEAERAILEQIFAQEDLNAANAEAAKIAKEQERAQEAANAAAQRTASSLLSAAKTLSDFADSARGGLGSEQLGLVATQQKFFAALNEFRGGDIEAAREAATLGQKVIDLARNSVGSSIELNRIVATVSEAASATAKTIANQIDPSLIVQENQLSVLEEIRDSIGIDNQLSTANLPAVATSASSESDLRENERLESIESRLSSIAESLHSGLFSIAKNTGETSKYVRRWDGEGLPPERETA